MPTLRDFCAVILVVLGLLGGLLFGAFLLSINLHADRWLPRLIELFPLVSLLCSGAGGAWAGYYVAVLENRDPPPDS